MNQLDIEKRTCSWGRCPGPATVLPTIPPIQPLSYSTRARCTGRPHHRCRLCSGGLNGAAWYLGKPGLSRPLPFAAIGWMAIIPGTPPPWSCRTAVRDCPPAAGCRIRENLTGPCLPPWCLQEGRYVGPLPLPPTDNGSPGNGSMSAEIVIEGRLLPSRHLCSMSGLPG